MQEPTGYTALDLIGFTDRGNYNPVTNYVKNDLVHYGGSIWRILIDDTMGQTPQEGQYYTVFVKEPTNMIERIMAPLEQNPATQAWAVGRQIINNDYLYEVIAPIAIGDNLVAYEDDPTNANIKLAPPIETQVLAIKNEADKTEDMIAPAESNPAAASHSVGDQIIFDNILYDVTSPIAASDALVAYPTAGYNIKPAAPVSSQIQALTNNKADKADEVLFLNNNGSGYGCAVSSSQADFCRIPSGTATDSNITEDHVVVDCVFSNPSAITSDVTWTTYNGYLKLNGVCASTCNVSSITLAKAGNI